MPFWERMVPEWTTQSPISTEEEIPIGIMKICTVEIVLNFREKSSHDKMSKSDWVSFVYIKRQYSRACGVLVIKWGILFFKMT